MKCFLSRYFLYMQKFKGFKMRILRTIFIGIVSIAVFLISCKNDEQAFVEGEVLFSVYDSVSFHKVYETFDSLKIKIKKAYDFRYSIKTTVDSVDTIKLILLSKNYLTKNGKTFGTSYKADTLNITANFFNFENMEANDWFETVDQLNLKENLIGNFFKWGILKVPFGQEQLWVNKLKQFSIIESIQLNHTIHINE